MAHLLSLSTVLLLLAGFSLAQLIAFLPPNSSPEHNTPPAVVGHTDLSIRQHRRHDSGSEYAPAPGPTPEIKADLLDIVLLASVDGKLHALNRTSGKALWSMSSSVSGTVPTTFGPLIRTQHPEFDPEATDDDREVYVIEPQSGEIYVMSSPTSPLQRLPFSMSQLVDMSPFSFATEGDDRVFVGYKKTSLLLVELETGKVKATLGAECPWDPFEDLVPEEKEYDDVDLDELEAVNPPRRTSKPTEVFIGRTGLSFLYFSCPQHLTSLLYSTQTTTYPYTQALSLPYLELLFRISPSPLMVPTTKTMVYKLYTDVLQTAHTLNHYQMGRSSPLEPI